MSSKPPYMPGPAEGAEIIKGEKTWTLALVRNLKHSPEKVWLALTDPVHLKEWAPFEPASSLDAEGSTVKIKWAGAPFAAKTLIKKAVAPKLLEMQDMKWELEPTDEGTRLTLWHSIDHRYIAMGASGWHICFDVLAKLLDGTPIGKIVGFKAMKVDGWKRLNAEYTELFGLTKK